MIIMLDVLGRSEDEDASNLPTTKQSKRVMKTKARAGNRPRRSEEEQPIQ